VYKLTAVNPADERRFYIGVRTSQVFPDLDPYMGSSEAVDSAIRAGVVFEKKILTVGFDRAQAFGIEQALLKFHDVVNNSEFFNVGICGHFAPRTGKTHTEKAKARISAAHVGKVVSAESRARMSVSRLGNTNAKGHVHSPETIKKMSESGKKFAATAEGRAAKSAAAKARWEKHRNAS
jgi:hypothetical protein